MNMAAAILVVAQGDEATVTQLAEARAIAVPPNGWSEAENPTYYFRDNSYLAHGRDGYKAKVANLEVAMQAE